VPFVYVAIMALADEQENELGLFDNVVVEMDVAQEECVIDSDISVMFAADQPCTSPTVHSDTAVVGPAFAQRKCILCCIDSDENLQALTSVGIQSLIDNCNPTGMTHISEYLTQHTDVRHIRHAGSKLLIKLAEHAKLKLPVETRQKCRHAVWLVRFLSRTCVFLWRVCHRL